MVSPAKAFPGARAIVGIAIRVQSGGSKYECIYLPPTNGRAGDMTRRNHSTRYISDPDWPWERLRKESPGAYEAAQPGLIVKDLKLGISPERSRFGSGLAMMRTSRI